MSDIPRPDQIDTADYARMPPEDRGRLRRAWRALATPRATTPRGYPYPLRSWPPDAAIDIQYLAEAVSTDIAGNVEKGAAFASISTTPGSFAIGWTRLSLTSFTTDSTAVFAASGDGGIRVLKAGYYSINAFVLLSAGTANLVSVAVSGVTAPSTAMDSSFGFAAKGPVPLTAAWPDHLGAGVNYYVWVYCDVAGMTLTLPARLSITKIALD